MSITYTYDNIDNRLTMTAEGASLGTSEVSDAGLFSPDNTVLELLVRVYGEE